MQVKVHLCCRLHLLFFTFILFGVVFFC